jgi:Na+/H+ antiporter NhaD/arsenite permease-like protein
MYKGKVMDLSPMKEEANYLDHIKDKRFAILVCGVFLLTIIAMANRPVFGCCLGFIALCGAITLIFVFEIFKTAFHIEIPSLENVVSELDWRAIFFYVSLFSLVGGLEHSGVIKIIADRTTPFI